MFKSALQQIKSKVPGVLGVLIVGNDGIIIEQVVQPSDLNFEILSAEFAALLKGVQRFSQGSELGSPEEIMLRTGQAKVVAKLITEEYYLLIVMDPQGNFGQAGHELRKAQLTLEGEFLI